MHYERKAEVGDLSVNFDAGSHFVSYVSPKEAVVVVAGFKRNQLEKGRSSFLSSTMAKYQKGRTHTSKKATYPTKKFNPPHRPTKRKVLKASNLVRLILVVSPFTRLFPTSLLVSR